MANETLTFSIRDSAGKQPQAAPDKAAKPKDNEIVFRIAKPMPLDLLAVDAALGKIINGLTELQTLVRAHISYQELAREELERGKAENAPKQKVG